jgi:hypothetical protein
MTVRPNPARLRKSLALLRRLTKLRSDPRVTDVELERASEQLAEHDSDARLRVDPRQLKLFSRE